MRVRWTWLMWGIGLLMLLTVGVITTTTSRDRGGRNLSPLDAHSVEPDGALALYLWTQRLGRSAEYLEYEPFKLEGDDALLVSLQPWDRYEPEHLRELRGWIEAGGSLLLATDGPAANLLPELGMTLVPTTRYTTASLAQPLLQHPPVKEARASGAATVRFERGVPLLVSGGPNPAPVLVSDRVGRGRVWVWTMPQALSNGQLGEADNWKVYLNVLADAREGDVLFDEYHRGKPDIVSLRALLLRERWGWAFWYTLVVMLAYFVLRGKRLGRPVTSGTTRYRSSGEYVRSLASMLKAGRKRDYLSDHYAESLARSLQQAAGLPPGAPLSELQRAAQENTGVPASKVTEAIQALSGNGSLDEKRMVRLVAEAERERKNLRRRRAW